MKIFLVILKGEGEPANYPDVNVSVGNCQEQVARAD